jgi:uncharacterized DUF497 family protein
VQFLSCRTCCGREDHAPLIVMDRPQGKATGRSGRDDTDKRFVTVDMVESSLLFVSYTLRGTRVRIISARAAEPFER